MLDTGSVLKGRYLIEKHLGKGGMGSVYLARDQTFGSLVALKETIVHGGGLEEAFEREAHVLNKLRHGAIPVVMDYFIEGDGRFLVMQYIPGDDLSTLIERSHKPFPPDKVLEWADKLLEALTYMHTQEPPVIHRDIKPQNMKLTDRGEIVLLDFGLSKSALGSDAAQSVSVVGYTPTYAPIEQIQGGGTDARSDLYSLAATIYHMITGVKPAGVLVRVTAAKDPLKPIHKIAPSVSKQVSDVLMAALSIQPEKRPASAAEMRMELRGAAFDDLLSLAHGFDTDTEVDTVSGEVVEGPFVGAAETPTIVPSHSEMPTVVPGRGDFAAAPAASSGAPIEAQTVLLSDMPPAAAVKPAVAFEAPTVVLPGTPFIALPPVEIAQPPRPVVRNTTAPSRASFVYKVATLNADGEVTERKKRVGKNYFEDTGGGTSIPLVEIKKGTFRFGSPDDEAEREDSEGPNVEVTIGAFYMSRSPVTQAQWRAVATSLPMVTRELSASPSQFAGDDRPVEMVSWEDATEFCERLASHTGRAYRLPSEAEWEYACRAGTTTAFATGPTITVEVANLDALVGYADGPEGEGRSETTPVESFKVANAFGLYDMHGNVWEWTEDRWHDTLAGAPTDGSPWTEGGDPTVRVVRGGSWASIPSDARSAKRFSFLQSGRRNDVGFRVVMAAVGPR